MSKVVELKTRKAWPVDLEDLRLPEALSARPPARKLRPRANEPFTLMTVSDLVRGAAVFENRGLLVWIYILHKAKLRGSDAIPLPNTSLKSWGVTPDMKTRALRRLEQAGLLRVEWRNRRSPVVTVLRC
jgi:hypothetical protein